MIGDDDLRDCFAMFALIGVSKDTDMEQQAKWCYEMADAMMEARIRREPEEGIVKIKRVRKT
jgi:hypothetical protein